MAHNERLGYLSQARQSGSSLRKQVRLLQSDPHAIIEDAGPMLYALTNRSLFQDTDRAAALRVALHALWSREQRAIIAGVLAACVEKETRARRPTKFAARWFCRGMVVSLVFWTGCAVTFPGDMPDPGFWQDFLGILGTSAVFTILMSFVTAPISVWYDNRRSLQLVSAVEVLARLGAKEAIVPIGAALTSDGPLRTVAAQELPGIVDTLTPEDYGSLPAGAIPILCRLLPAVGAETALVILRALTIVGDGRAIFAVEYAAHNSANPEVRKAALKLIPVLSVRANENRVATMLLRPSSASPEAEDTLLRPVREPLEENCSLLLLPHTDQPGRQPLQDS